MRYALLLYSQLLDRMCMSFIVHMVNNFVRAFYRFIWLNSKLYLYFDFGLFRGVTPKPLTLPVI